QQHRSRADDCFSECIYFLMQETRSEIIGLLRGQVACPVLANLAELGWLDQMLEASFNCASFPEAEPAATKSVFKYLAALGLIIEQRESTDRYVGAEFGRKFCARYVSCC